MTAEQPLKDYQKHIANTHADHEGKAICGATLIGWHYIDLDHAFLSAPKDRLQPCPACAEIVIKVFTECE